PPAVPRSAVTCSRPTAASSVALRDTTITRAPAADSCSAASRPIPRPPPVTSATRPFIHQLPILCSRERDTLGHRAKAFQQKSRPPFDLDRASTSSHGGDHHSARRYAGHYCASL